MIKIDGSQSEDGGQIRVEIEPAARLIPIELLKAKPVIGTQALATVSGLDGLIAKRELSTVGAVLGWEADQLQVEQIPGGACAGNVVTLVV